MTDSAFSKLIVGKYDIESAKRKNIEHFVVGKDKVYFTKTESKTIYLGKLYSIKLMSPEDKIKIIEDIHVTGSGLQVKKKDEANKYNIYQCKFSLVIPMYFCFYNDDDDSGVVEFDFKVGDLKHHDTEVFELTHSDVEKNNFFNDKKLWYDNGYRPITLSGRTVSVTIRGKIYGTINIEIPLNYIAWLFGISENDIITGLTRNTASSEKATVGPLGGSIKLSMTKRRKRKNKRTRKYTKKRI
jgi:hypothetical protein